ncbi:hypothetical protein [Thermoactinospora rubra]|uniref:hypothetical protein n=1 Tax=Thermoactinospora rubra TaxID=1088767 RepID=UPI00197EE696
MNVDPSNDARRTALHTCARSGPIASTRTPGSFTGSVRSRCSGVHGSPACQPFSDSSSWIRAPFGASTYAFPSGRTPRPGSVTSSTSRRASSSSR